MPTIALLALRPDRAVLHGIRIRTDPLGWRNGVLQHEAIWDRVLHPGAALIEGLAPVRRVRVQPDRYAQGGVHEHDAVAGS